jgi:hypothetical protein
MFSGLAEQAFGPSEIEIMRRAMTIAARSLSLETSGDAGEPLRLLARSILQQTAMGQSDPLVISAHALREQQAVSLRTFQPYERRSLTRRSHTRRKGFAPHSRKIA